MAVIALSIEPYAVPRTCPKALARTLGLDLVDLRPFELEIADAVDGGGPDAVVPIMPPGQSLQWTMHVRDLANRLRELTLEAALNGNVLVTGFTSATILRPLPHVAAVRLRASRTYRATALQQLLRYQHLSSALMDLDSEDTQIARFVAQCFQSDWHCPSQDDLAIDTERVVINTAVDLIDRLLTDERYTETAEARDAVNHQLADLCR